MCRSAIHLVSRFANTDQIPCLPDPRKDGSDWAASGALAAALPPIPGIRFLVGNCDSGHSHVRHFKLQARIFLACPPSRSAQPPLGEAGGTIMKRRLIML